MSEQDRNENTEIETVETTATKAKIQKNIKKTNMKRSALSATDRKVLPER